MSDWENYAWLHGGMNVIRNNTHVLSYYMSQNYAVWIEKVRGSFSPRNTEFQQSMPTNRKAVLYFKLNFPPEIQKQILMEMNTHLETKIIHKNLTFIGPCIVIYFYSKTNQMLQFLKFVLFWNNTLHVSEVFPSIIRSSRLYIQQQVYVEQILLPACAGSSLELLVVDGKTVRNM